MKEKSGQNRRGHHYESWILLSFTHACSQFLATFTFRALHGKHIVSTPFRNIVEEDNEKKVTNMSVLTLTFHEKHYPPLDNSDINSNCYSGTEPQRKSVFANASSIVLMGRITAWLVACNAVEIAATMSTWSCTIAVRTARKNFFPIPRFWTNWLLVCNDTIVKKDSPLRGGLRYEAREITACKAPLTVVRWQIDALHSQCQKWSWPWCYGGRCPLWILLRKVSRGQWCVCLPRKLFFDGALFASSRSKVPVMLRRVCSSKRTRRFKAVLWIGWAVSVLNGITTDGSIFHSPFAHVQFQQHLESCLGCSFSMPFTMCWRSFIAVRESFQFSFQSLDHSKSHFLSTFDNSFPKIRLNFSCLQNAWKQETLNRVELS